MTLKVCFINITTGIIGMDYLTAPLYLGRLRLERLTSNQMVGQYFRTACMHKQPTLFGISPRPQWPEALNFLHYHKSLAVVRYFIFILPMIEKNTRSVTK